MPLVQILCNAALSQDVKGKLDTCVREVLVGNCGSNPAHVHVLIQDHQFFSFGGDASTPAVQVNITTASQQIDSSKRRALVEVLVPVLTSQVAGLPEARVSTFFHELPVEQIAVGSSIIVFAGTGTGSKAHSPR